MEYKVYGTKQVDDAYKSYYNVANNAPVYRDSAATNAARAQADAAAGNYMSAVNRGYNSPYQQQIDRLTDRYQNNTFDYDAKKSAEYQAYSDYYHRQGDKAQEHTQGSYAANTGGYSNSYAMAAGQRAYGEQMEQLAAKVPALRQTALQNWNQQQEQTLNQISMLKGFDDSTYARYRDKVNDTFNFMQYYQQKYSTERGLDMSAFQQELSKWQAHLSAQQSNLANIRQLAESQYEHGTLSADTRASLDQATAQNNAYYNYLYSRIS